MPSFWSSIISDLRDLPNKSIQEQSFYIGILISVICLAGLLYYIIDSTNDEEIVFDRPVGVLKPQESSTSGNGSSSSQQLPTTKAEVSQQHDTFDSFKKLMEQSKDLTSGSSSRYCWTQNEREIDLFGERFAIFIKIPYSVLSRVSTNTLSIRFLSVCVQQFFWPLQT